LRKIFLLCLLCAVSGFGWSSEYTDSLRAPKTHRIHLAAGVASMAEKDFGFSPLIYSGAGFYGGLGYSIESVKKSFYIDFDFNYGFLKNRFDNGMNSIEGGINTFHFYHPRKDVNDGIHFGWSSRQRFGLRQNEAIVNFNNRFDYFTAFGPALRYRLPFMVFKRNFSFDAVAHWQLIGFLVQSGFVSNAPKGFENTNQSGFNQFLQSLEVFYPGSAWNFGIWPSLRYTIKNQNYISVQYRYNFLNLKGAQDLGKSHGVWFLNFTVEL
jgi:hypothetical protein